MPICAVGGDPCASCIASGECLALADATVFTQTPSRTKGTKLAARFKLLIRTHAEALQEALRMAELHALNIEDELPEYDGYESLKAVTLPGLAGAGLIALQVSSITSELTKHELGYERYEKLRKLNPRQFQELWETNLTTGQPFDGLVDKI